MSEMETTPQATSGEQVVSTPAASEAPATQSVAAVDTSQSAPVEQAPAYQPNYKFRYPKAGQEHAEAEFDEWIRGAVNKENEEKIRDLYTKAHGMDFYKDKSQKHSESFREYREKYDPLVKAWGELSQQYNSGDVSGFFKSLNIDDDTIFKYALDKLQERELPQEERAFREQSRETSRRAQTLEQKYAELESKYQQTMVQSRASELDRELGAQDVSSIAQEFDGRIGRQGAFKEEVIKRGAMIYQTTGQDLSPKQVIGEMVGMYKPLLQPGQAPQQMQPTQNQFQQSQSMQKPVLPSAGGRSASPVKRAPRSLDDIRKIADSL